MNMYTGAGSFERSPVSSSVLSTLFKLLITILSSPKGNQGGWEGGARGL